MNGPYGVYLCKESPEQLANRLYQLYKDADITSVRRIVRSMRTQRESDKKRFVDELERLHPDDWTDKNRIKNVLLGVNQNNSADKPVLFFPAWAKQ